MNAGEIDRLDDLEEAGQLALALLVCDPPRVIGRQVLGQQQVEGDPHRIPDRDRGHVGDA
jgi:hypothetical protein